MNKIKLLSLCLVIVMILSALASCNNKAPAEDETSLEDTGEQHEQLYAETINVVDAKGSSGLTGDFKAAFQAEKNGENRIVGKAQNPVCYSICASLPSHTVITRILLTAPSENQSGLSSATIDASVDGRKWTTLCTLDEGIVAGKNYNLNITNEKKFSYIRVRQSESHRTESFAFRNMVIEGIPYEGDAGVISNIEEETDISTLLTPKSLITSNATAGDAANVFIDNSESYTANCSTDGKNNYVVGTLQNITDIRKITVKLWDSNRSARGTTVEVSNDGVNWVVLYTLPDLRKDGVTAENGEFTYYVNPNESYSYVRLAQNSLFTAYEEWTLNTVLLYEIEENEQSEPFPRKFIDAETVSVTYHDSHVEDNSESVTPDIIWDTSDKTTSYTHKLQEEKGTYYIAGKFAAPTVITEIIYHSPASNANRVRTSYFEVSVDGETWVNIATLTGSSEAYAYSAKLGFVINDDTAYNYIRLVQGENFYKYYWTVGTVEVKGVSGN